MSNEQTISKDFSSDGNSAAQQQEFGRERGARWRGAFPRHRLVVLSLGLLNVVLLIVAVVLGTLCAKDYLPVPNSAATSLVAEMNFFRNKSHIVKVMLEAQATLAKERADFVGVKLKIRSEKAITDNLMRQIEALNVVKANLQSDAATLAISCGKCQPGWILLKSACYYFSSMDTSNAKKNWIESRRDCVSRGGDLVMIHSLEEQQLISNYFTSFSTQTTGSAWWLMGSWIGLTDAVTPGAWMWINNVTQVETLYWRTGQPTANGSQSGNCAAFFSYHDTRKAWYNMDCKEHLLNWICEIELK